MKVTITRTLLAATAMLLCGGTAAEATDLRFTDIERRLASLESQAASQDGVQTASYSHGGECATGGCGNGSCSACNPCEACCAPCGGRYYGEVQFLWIRPHASEDWVGKLSESHDFAPRYVFGYEDCCGWGGRTRFWRFDDDVTVLDPSVLGIELDVWDIEATNRFHLRKTDIVVGAGFRYAGWDLADEDGAVVNLDAYGLTMAADLRTLVWCCGRNQVSFVYGGRMSILAGDWEGDNDIIDTFAGEQVRDDMVYVPELYVGVEYGYRYCDYDLFMRASYEIQSWRSDVLSEPGIGNGLAPGSIGSTNSVGFIGPGLHLGVRY